MILKPADYPFWLRVVVVLSLAFFAINVIFFLAPLMTLLVIARNFFGVKEVATGIIGLIGTLFATFIGAWLAFRFARIQRDREKIEKEVAAGNRALFTLTQMYDQTAQHQKEIVDEVRKKPLPWFSLPVALPLNENLSFDTQGLLFLLQGSARVFQQLLLEESRFKLLAYKVEEHRTTNYTLVWPRLEGAGIKLGEARSVEDLKNILGPAGVNRLKVIGEGIIKNCDDNVVSLKNAILDLRPALKKIYPDEKFIDFKFDDTATS